VGQDLQFVLKLVFLQGEFVLRTVVNGRMEIDFSYSLGKIPKESKDQIKVHVTAIVHAKDKVIPTQIGFPQSGF
jgi:hypothetical protein